jgi:phosphate transport system substrate-binding protein
MRVSGMFTLGVALTGSALAWTLTGCGGGGDASAPTGTVVVDGSSTVFRISNAAQEAYSQVKPEVDVVVDLHGTGGGFSRYLQGEVDIVDASRPAKPDEEAKAKAQGIEWTRFLVGYDGITVVINPGNEAVRTLSVDQLKAIWAPASTVKTWKDVDPAWPERKIVLYSPDRDSGTFEFFTEAIVGKARSQREDVQASSDDNILVKGVAGDRDGLGYFGYAYFKANTDKLRAVSIRAGGDPGAPAVSPSPATILDKTYSPLARPLYLYVKNSAMRRPEVAGFLKYYVENNAILAEKAGYVAPTAEDMAANRKALGLSGGVAASDPGTSPTPQGRPS